MFTKFDSTNHYQQLSSFLFLLFYSSTYFKSDFPGEFLGEILFVFLTGLLRCPDDIAGIVPGDVYDMFLTGLVLPDIICLDGRQRLPLLNLDEGLAILCIILCGYRESQHNAGENNDNLFHDVLFEFGWDIRIRT